jgi:Domain of unknown function (DUF4394)
MRRTQAAVLSLSLLFALGCDGRDSPMSPAAEPVDPMPNQLDPEMVGAETMDAEAADGMGGLIFGVDADNYLIAFGRRNPGTLNRRIRITGTDGKIVGLDFRPNDLNPADGRDMAGKLFGLTKTSVYAINPMTGVATRARTLTAPLTGTFFGTGFNPTVDRLRSHADGGQNNAVNVDDGVTAVNAPLAYASGDVNAGKAAAIVGTAYTNSVNPAPATTILYAIDAAQDALVRLAVPADGQLATVGALRFPTNGYVGFDIDGASSAAFASLTRDGASASVLFSVNLQTGRVTRIGRINNSSPLVGLAVAR